MGSKIAIALLAGALASPTLVSARNFGDSSQIGDGGAPHVGGAPLVLAIFGAPPAGGAPPGGGGAPPGGGGVFGAPHSGGAPHVKGAPHVRSGHNFHRYRSRRDGHHYYYRGWWYAFPWWFEGYSDYDYWSNVCAARWGYNTYRYYRCMRSYGFY